MKTKEQLKDIKLFADFIEVIVLELKDICKDTKTIVSSDYAWLHKELNVYIIFNPQDDWNLLIKAIEKARDIYFGSNTYDELDSYLDSIDDALTIKNNLNDKRGYIYDYLIMFIKGYNEINTNTNNNQS